jgi:hypothetical protein
MYPQVIQFETRERLLRRYKFEAPTGGAHGIDRVVVAETYSPPSSSMARSSLIFSGESTPLRLRSASASSAACRSATATWIVSANSK